MAEKAKVYTYTVINSASEEFKDKVPYVVAVLENKNGRFASFIEGYKDGINVDIGMEVEFSRFDEAQNPIYKF